MLSNKEWLEEALDPFRDLGLEAKITPDEEHNLFKIVPGQNTNGYRWVKPIGRDFMAAPEYRTLLELYKDVEPFENPPLVVTESSDKAETLQVKELASQEELVDYLLTAGKKGPRDPTLQRPR